MGFLDKAKSAAEQAAARAKEGVEDVQVKRELSQAYGELGRAAHDLIESGEISHPSLAAQAEKIRALKERATGDEPYATTTAGDSDQPPAMPT